MIWVGRGEAEGVRMARDSDQRAGSFEIENTGGLLSGLLAEEDVFDRRALWRIGSWGAAAVWLRSVLAVLANQSQLSLRREQVAAADLTRQTQQMQSFTRESTERDPEAGFRRRYAERRPGPAVFARHRAGTGSGFRDRCDCQAKCRGGPTSGRCGSTPGRCVTGSGGTSDAVRAEVGRAKSRSCAVSFPCDTRTGGGAGRDDDGHAAHETGRQAAAGRRPRRSRCQRRSSPLLRKRPIPRSRRRRPSPLVAAKSMMAPPDPAATKLTEPEKPAKTVTAGPMPEVVAAAPAVDKMEADTPPAAVPQATAADVAVQKTEFGVDIGGANRFPACARCGAAS